MPAFAGMTVAAAFRVSSGPLLTCGKSRVSLYYRPVG
jgi:hypothetical protein